MTIDNLPDGWFSEQDIESYRRLYEQVPYCGTTCEVGSYHGRSLCSVADIIKRSQITVHVVDTWGHVETGHGGPQDEHVRIFIDAMKRFGILGQVVTHLGWSVKVARELPMFDLIMIDGDHHQHAVVEDLKAYRPLLRPNGILCGHDLQFEGVEQALKQVCPVYKSLPQSLWRAEV